MRVTGGFVPPGAVLVDTDLASGTPVIELIDRRAWPIAARSHPWEYEQSDRRPHRQIIGIISRGPRPVTVPEHHSSSLLWSASL